MCIRDRPLGRPCFTCRRVLAAGAVATSVNKSTRWVRVASSGSGPKTVCAAARATRRDAQTWGCCSCCGHTGYRAR
eukprot:5113292-Alexandrium_andersonii.AAC.1